MNTRAQLMQLATVAALTCGLFLPLNAQEPTALSLTSAERTVPYPEVICVHCIVPVWDQHFLLHSELDTDPALVTMYDRDGKKLIEGRVTLPGTFDISVRALGATSDGTIIAGGGAGMPDGSIQRFIAHIDSTGKTVESINTDDFAPQQVCAASDGTVWTEGYSREALRASRTDSDILRHYSFSKGLLGSFVPLNSVSDRHDAIPLITSPGRSFLRCGKENISILFSFADQSTAKYVMVNSSTGKLDRWEIRTPTDGGRVDEFAIAENGEVYVSLHSVSRTDNKTTMGLFQLKTTAGIPIANLIPVAGTQTTYDNYKEVPDQTVIGLVGADGDELVVRRVGDGPALAWAKIIPATSGSD
jgi:hypothetical protein